MNYAAKVVTLSFLSILLAGAVFAQSDPVVGEWKNGSVGSVQYKDRVTGSTTPGRGSVFTYRFLSNGNYEFTGYMQSTMYNCTTTLFNQITGRYTVVGSEIQLSPSRDLWKSTNSCAKGGNRQQTKVPVKKSLDFEIRTDEYGAELLCLSENGSETCFRKAVD
ncbi:MAG TPA: hypothetical protein PKD24_03305 [Pyrinomonadaceae bacterium]|nr:hypothetical protein [Pyrinomonadaceae bacterium]HMP64578.1 hypothetical protein [Pyrinomonadaceae bacterium]